MFFWLVTTTFQACEKDPIYVDYDRGGELKLIIRDGAVDRLAVNDEMCLFNHKDALVRYTIWDGSFTHYSWINTNIGKVIQLKRDKENKLYVADSKYGVGYFDKEEYKTVWANNGVDDFDISGELITRRSSNVVYKLSSSPNNKSLWVFRNQFTCLASYGDRAYVGTDRGLYRYSVHGPEGVFVAGNGQLRDSHVKDLRVHKGDLWVLTHHAVSQKYAENDFHIYDLPDGVFGNKLFICHNQVLVTSNHGVYKLKEDGFEPFTDLNEQFDEDETIQVVEADSQGKLWVGTSKGLYTYTPW